GSLGLWLFTKLVLPHRLELAQGVAFFFGVLALILAGRTVVRSAVAPRLARGTGLLTGGGRVAEVLLRKVPRRPGEGRDPVGSAVEADDVEGVSVLGMSPPEFSRSSRWMKRAMDVVFATAVLLAAAPLMLLAAIAIRLTSRGPILFSQERIGRSGRRFRIRK